MKKGVDIDAMLYENNVRINFNEHIKKEVKKLDQVVTEKDRMNRVDYRMLKTVTIDGDDARDFDDAKRLKRMNRAISYMFCC